MSNARMASEDTGSGDGTRTGNRYESTTIPSATYTTGGYSKGHNQIFQSCGGRGGQKLGYHKINMSVGRKL